MPHTSDHQTAENLTVCSSSRPMCSLPHFERSSHHSFSDPSSCTLHSSFGESFHQVSNIASILSGEYPFPDLGTQISISRLHAIGRISFVRYHPFLLVNPPLETFSEVRWAFSPFGLIPSNLVPYRSRKEVISWDCRSVPGHPPESPRGGLIRQMIQSSSSTMIFLHSPVLLETYRPIP